MMFLVALCFSLASGQATYEQIQGVIENIYSCFASKNFSCIVSLNDPSTVWRNYDLPFLSSTGVFLGSAGIANYFKQGFGFYNYSHLLQHPQGLPWVVDARQGAVAVPLEAQGTIVPTGASATSHNLHFWTVDVKTQLITSWTQYKVTYLQEPVKFPQ
jgi:hypothetical protein